jgi:hypothetical protein
MQKTLPSAHCSLQIEYPCPNCDKIWLVNANKIKWLDKLVRMHAKANHPDSKMDDSQMNRCHEIISEFSSTRTSKSVLKTLQTEVDTGKSSDKTLKDEPSVIVKQFIKHAER